MALNNLNKLSSIDEKNSDVNQMHTHQWIQSCDLKKQRSLYWQENETEGFILTAYSFIFIKENGTGTECYLCDLHVKTIDALCFWFLCFNLNRI